MPLPISVDQGNQNDNNVDTLGQVQLISFRAEPASIGPFGASTLSRHVEGPSGFLVESDRPARTLRIDNGNNGAGIIEVTACPQDLFLTVAAISASLAIE